MNPADKNRDDAEPWRRAAAARLAGRDTGAPPGEGDVQRLLFELQLHQTELEMQNEALSQTQIDLEKSRDRYAALYDFAPVGYLTLSAGVISEANLAGAKLLGTERANLLNKRFSTLVAAEDAERWQGHVSKLSTGDAPGPVELVLRRDDGAMFHAQIDCLLQDGHADEATILMALRDISEQVHAGDKLRQLSLAVEQSSNGVVITDLQGNIEYANAAFLTATGYTAEEALGRNPKFLKSGLTPRETYEDLWRTLGAGKVWRGEFLNRRKNGQVYPESEIISPVRRADGRVTHYIGIREDITERRRNELLLQRSVWRWSLAADSAGIGVWEWDLAANTVMFDDQMHRLYGLEPGRFEGTFEAWQKRVHPDDVETASRDVDRALRAEAPFDTEFRVVWPDGKVRIIKANGLVVRNAEGRPLTMVGINQDFTRRKRTEGAYRQAVQRLKKLSRRVLEVQEAERRRLAIELHDELGQALTAIKFNLHGKQEPRTDLSAAEANAGSIAIVEAALQQVRRLALALRPSILDDLGLIPALLWLAEQTETRGELVVAVHADELPSRLAPEVETVCFRIVQEALTNITRHSGAQLVEIDLHRESHGLTLRVQDDGCGFDPASVRARALAGNSMGVLAMEERAEFIGGQLELESTPGRGSTVTLRCPLQPPEEAT